ncbi:MAG: alpha/beta hydrolase fold protein [Blastococcus sp.]|nr:alpha/beta hydrolase fold protein [Blastococcus sp.]
MPSIRVNGFDMHYQVVGHGPPLVCITGWGTGAGHGFAAYPRQLADNYQIIFYDHRGVGASSGGLDREPSTELYADDVAQLITALGLPAAHVFGRGGLGGCITQRLAIQHPDLVSSAILGQSWAFADATLDAQLMALAALRRISFEDFQRACAWLCYDPQYFEHHQQALLGPDGSWSDIKDTPEAHLALIQASRTHDAREDLHTMSCPTLVIQAGANDWITGARLGDEISRRLPGSEMLYLSDAPHAVSTHAPSWALYTDALMRFLALAAQEPQ